MPKLTPQEQQKLNQLQEEAAKIKGQGVEKDKERKKLQQQMHLTEDVC